MIIEASAGPLQPPDAAERHFEELFRVSLSVFDTLYRFKF